MRPRLILLALLALPAARSGVPHAAHSGGQVRLPVSCNAASQAGFDRALTLLHHMTYPQAREAFAEVVAAEPDCAMAHWGIAMTLFQPLWPTRPGPEARARGWEELSRARALAPPTPRERAFIATAEAFFRDPAAEDYWARIRRWSDAAQAMHAHDPDDEEAAVFAALGLLATTPADRSSRANADRAAAILARMLAHDPEHPGAMHYLVHANDVPGRERESLAVTRHYESIAPDNPHALHMPTHIYTRLGDWDGVVRGNLRAADAALKHPAGEQGEYVWDEFPHAIEYLVYALLQQGRDDEAAAQVRRLQATARLEPSFKTAFHLASTQARLALERRDWDAAAAITPREPTRIDWKRFPWPESVAWFARGLGAVHTGDIDAAHAAVTRLAVLEEAGTAAGETLFARSIRVSRLELEAWLAQARGEHTYALARMREAAELEAATPKHAVTPGPTLPAGEQLGDLLIAQRQPAAALEAYRATLARQPRRFNALLGMARAAAAAGDREAARAGYRSLLEVAGNGRRGPALEEARRALEER
ncbi:MAG: hypothetical protein EOP90_04345 [Lysobacteraceae bacterium]|nr:MAG: hypothetical protein EOP90_04345 [Xanthomonadaceae bacterium]